MIDTGRLSIACVVGSSFSFSITDVSIKFLSDSYPLHQLVLMRSVIALALTLIFVMSLGGGLKSLKTRRPLLHACRGLCVVIANLAFFSGIAVIPLAEATATFFVAPLLIAGFSAVILKERVGVRRWLALAAGFSGVLLIVRPGGVDYQWAALLPVLAAVAYATLHTITRNMGLSENAAAMAVYIHLTFIFACSAMGLAFGDGRFAGSGHPAVEFVLRAWQWPQGFDLVIICITGLASAVGAYLISQAYRLSEAGLVAPFEYTVLVLAVFWGYLIWGELPSLLAFVGIALVLGSGVFVAVREAGLGRGPSARRISGRRWPGKRD